MLEYLTNYGTQNINIITLSVGIVLAFFLGLFVCQIYRSTHRGMIYDSSFLITLLLMGPLITIIIVIIGHNIALSIGLVGSLSIIRFRTVIKDSKELIYLLWAMSIGLACGSENWMAIIVGTLIIACLILIIYYFQYGTNYKKDLVLIISSSENIDNNKITNILDEYKCNYNLRSIDKTGDRYQIVYELKNIILVKNSSKDIMEKIEKEIKVENISILSPNLTHPL